MDPFTIAMLGLIAFSATLSAVGIYIGMRC